MLPKSLLTTFLLLSLCLQVRAQSKIEGNIADANGKALANATVLLLHAKDSSLVKGSMSNKDGTYHFENIPNGQYLVSSTFTGYKEVYSALMVINNNSSVHASTLALTTLEKTLNQVTVNAKKPLFEQSIDRLIINVAGSVSSAGSTALDVLMRSPGIVVDQQNNTISMNGKDGVVVMMNGKISRMPLSAVVQMLAGMSAANIEKIELITTPPANFDAEGNAGFINIVLKTSSTYGTNGSYSATLGYGRGLVTAASGNFNHRSNKLNIFGDHSYSTNNMITDFIFYRKVVMNAADVESLAGGTRNFTRQNNIGRLGVDYDLSKKTVVGVLVSGISNIYKMQERNNSNIFLNRQLDTIIKSKNKENHPLLNFAANLNLQHQFTPQEKLSFNLDYIYFTNDNVIDYLTDYHKAGGSLLRKEFTQTLKKTPINFWVGSSDYSKKLGKKTDMEAGLKYTVSRFTNDVQVERIRENSRLVDEGLTSKYFLNESIAAAYSSFNIKFNNKTSAKLGLRYEYTNSNLGSATVKDIIDRHYGRLFPTVFISHRKNDKTGFNFAYSRRITRPTFNDMAPFVYFIDPNTFFSGNPALQPSISNAVKGDYLYKRNIISVTYTREANPITNYAPKVDPQSNKQTFAAENQKEKNILALTLSLPMKVTTWWSMQNNISAMRQELHAIYKGEHLLIAQNTMNINSTQTFTLPKNITFEMSGFYRTAALFGVYKIKAAGTVNAGLMKKFKPQVGALRLAVNNVFGPPHLQFDINFPERNLVTNGDIYFFNRDVTLTYSRSFGNNKIKTSRARSTADEEKQRVQTN